MNIVEIKLSELKDYENNPRKNDGAVDAVAESIKQFGFKNPIIIDKDFVIVAGHTRKRAAEKLGLKTAPCIIADDLTEEQIQAFRLVDNKTAELAEWDYQKLEEELRNMTIDMEQFGFDHLAEIDWAGVEDLTESSYEEPEKDLLECPNCHHIDSKAHFRKIKSRDEIEKVKLDNYTIENATLDDIDGVKAIADKYQDEIGFVLRPALEKAALNNSLIVAKKDNKVLAFCNYNKRKADGVNVIYEICTDYKYRGNGIARKIIDTMKKPISLKCPVGNESNNFYAALGFELKDVEQGKKRQLNVWELN